MSGALDHSGGVAFRAPLLPLATFAGLTGGAARAAWTAGDDLDGAVADDVANLDAALRRLLADATVRAAVAYASPDLDAAVERWLGDPSAPPPRGLLGYVARMSWRCAPFGLFAGCAAGGAEGEPAFRLGDERVVRARLDVAEAERLAAATATAYVPNSTLHRLGDRLRLVERVAAGEGVRYHPLAVEENDAIRAVLDRARDGAPLADLANALVDDEVTYDEAAAFVGELVAAQLLVPDVAVVTGDVPASATGGHVDMSRPGTFVPGGEVLREARRAVELLHPLYRETTVDEELDAFREAYAARYGDVAMPLLEVLDPEHGIGYGAAPALAASGAPLLAGLNPESAPDGPRWTPVDHHLLDLLARAMRDGAREIEPSAADLHSMRDQRPRPLPPSLALVATVAARSAEAVAAGEFRLVVHGASGPNAVAAFSRFAPLDPGIDALARRHVREEERRADATLAEVVHLPPYRSGNVAVRPALRPYEIPVLAAAGVPPAGRILPADLTVEVTDGRIVLRDGGGREVVPRLSAPHDAQASALPLYRFLAAVQQEGTAAVLGWSWGQVGSAPFLPRVVAGRLVLARAQWLLFKNELAPLAGARSDAVRYAALQRLREAWDLPRWATLARGEAEIPVDLDGVAAAALLAREARATGRLALRELLPGPDELVLTGREGAFAHELVLPLHGSARQSPARRVRPRATVAYVPGSAWLDVAVVTGPATADAVLREVVAPFVAGAQAWSYERRETPSPHLRLRVAGNPAALLPALRDRLAPLVASGRVADVRLETYRPSPADAVAHPDSVAALRLVARGDDLDARWRAALRGVDRLLADAGLDPAGRRELVGAARDRLAAAYGDTAVRARRHAGRLHRARRDDLGARDPFVERVLDERSARVAPLLRGAPADVVEAACAAHVARLLRAAHDVQRIVLYDLLDRSYRALAARG